jgi:hypothetical protein
METALYTYKGSKLTVPTTDGLIPMAYDRDPPWGSFEVAWGLVRGCSGLGQPTSSLACSTAKRPAKRRARKAAAMPALIETVRAIGVSGMMAKRDSAAPVNTPTCRQLRHSTVTVGPAGRSSRT